MLKISKFILIQKMYYAHHKKVTMYTVKKNNFKICYHNIFSFVKLT